jgi:retrotransposon gag protein
MMNTMHTTMTYSQHLQDHREPLQPIQLQARPSENSSVTGDLIGAPPTTFDGDRSQTDHFITQFRLFRIVNNTHAAITNPMRRVALALTYIRGPNVDAWVFQQFNDLSAKVLGDANHGQTHTDTDEALWDDFITEIKRAYGETLWEVKVRLENLQMTGDDIETYIATFEYLLRRAEREREDISTVDSFRQGLPTNLQLSILGQQTISDTLDEWQSAARKEVERRFTKNFYLRRHEEDADTALQTGVIRPSRMSEEEIVRFSKEADASNALKEATSLENARTNLEQRTTETEY